MSETDDLVSRARRHAETHPESRELIEELLEELLEAVVRWACFAAPPPAPPWPGAVLSGLTDEDGVPTWLAQAGQVRGEQVRRRSDFAWVNNDQMVAHLDTVWVEVRDPRAVPEPETERVPWYRAILDLPSYQWVRESPTPPPVPPWPDGVLRDAANRLRWIANSGYIEDPGIKRIIRSWADELDATPAPPWPGAVLSGLTDEDGVPTWLAQAGQVRGEQVRFGQGGAWWPNTLDDYDPALDFDDDRWVEVRAPRTVPVPETERVPWWEANDRELVDGLLCVENAMIREVGREGDRVYVCGYEDPDNPDEDDRGDWKRNYWFGRDGFDGTVEVLKDGDR